MFRRAEKMTPPCRQAGMAIGVILAAVAVTVALGIAFTYSMRAGSQVSETNAEALLAANLVQQAATLKTAIINSNAKTGGWLEAAHLNANLFSYASAAGVGVYGPYAGAADPQTPPPGAVTVSSNGWRWGGDNWNYQILLPNAVYYQFPLTLSYLQPSVCAQINKILTGSAAIPAVSLAVDLQTASNAYIDLSGQASLNSYTEICFKDSRGVYQYYKAVQDNTA